MELRNNYYVSSFFWSTFQKVVSAIVGFISVPLLLGYFGKADYGILGIATACNGYMHLLDLGMNVGAIKFFSQWKAEGRNDLIERVARTNISFYGIISVINVVGLLVLAFWGGPVFSVTTEQFLQLRICLLIIALFSILSWGATTFNQLLVANMQLAYTMQLQSVLALLKGLLIGAVFLFSLSLTHYFFLLTGLVGLLAVPYAIKCKKLKLINSFRPAVYWKDFKVVISFSLSIFALSLFQMTSTQSRPIVLSIFAGDGAEAVADFRIIEVIPQFIIMICGTFSSIFLPKTSELVASKRQTSISLFAYKWTIITTILANCFCFPFMLGAENIVMAYVGTGYEYLATWLFVWIICVLLQVHSTPTNALILAYGKTKVMVYVSATACFISIIINAIMAKFLGVGSAVIGYSVYILINLCSYYGFYFRRVLNLSNIKIINSFIKPTFCGVVSMLLVIWLTNDITFNLFSVRITELSVFMIKAVLWLIFYSILIFVTRTIRINEKNLVTAYDEV